MKLSKKQRRINRVKQHVDNPSLVDIYQGLTLIDYLHDLSHASYYTRDY